MDTDPTSPDTTEFDRALPALEGQYPFVAEYRKRWEALRQSPLTKLLEKSRSSALAKLLEEGRTSPLAKLAQRSAVARAGLVSMGLPLDHPILQARRLQTLSYNGPGLLQRKRAQEDDMEFTNATYNGTPIKIKVPRSINCAVGAAPLELATPATSRRDRRGGILPPQHESQASAPPSEAQLSPYARRFVKSVDFATRTVVFKGKHRPKVTLPPDSDGAWSFLLRLLTASDAQGWVELATVKESRWQGHFQRYDEKHHLDAKNPLTNLLCRIESRRARGRPRAPVGLARRTKHPAPNTPHPAPNTLPAIRLTTFDKPRFDGYARLQSK